MLQDEVCKRRGIEWATTIAQALVQEGIDEPDELVGLELDSVKFESLDAVKRAAIVRLQRRLKQQSEQPSEGDSALAKFVQDQADKTKKPEKVTF